MIINMLLYIRITILNGDDCNAINGYEYFIIKDTDSF